eukprot:CAMPEP_0172036414 /NCGR_PEP_ID=MMETSP1041-20130122/22155_1 /TAXON_ID=464988 /ORGANISM="Hemiselmis andersenii, Strain CCMP439" /LENGTH=364 /DNA_ID=CAMNT_0012693649 /DNA_START=37 /DNA_END=1126 /DNA_ORIENTATION=+
MADGGGMFDSFFKKASASVKVLAKDAVQSTATLVNKVAETDVQGVARRLQHKVMEKADANYANVEELPEVESAMLNLKQTDQAYRELHAVLLETFVAQCKAANRQLRAANRAQVIGLDLETEAVGSAMGSFGNHLTVSAERSQELHSVKEGAEVEERARDDFGSRVYDTPAAKLVSSLASFIQTELAQALVARTKYKDSRREAGILLSVVCTVQIMAMCSVHCLKDMEGMKQRRDEEEGEAIDRPLREEDWQERQAEIERKAQRKLELHKQALSATAKQAAQASIYTKKVADLEAKGLADKAEEAKRQAAEGTKQMEADRDELLRHFMTVEQRKPALQTVVQAYLQAQLQYHQQCLLSADNAIA